MATIGFSDQEINGVQAIVASVLLLGNLDFDENNAGEAEVINQKVLEAIARNMGVDKDKFYKGFTTETKKMHREVFTKTVSAPKAEFARDAVAKALYDRLFQWLVARLDVKLKPDAGIDVDAHGRIGILDIFGFENFKHNGFDQMCINLANEQLHFYFNQHIFAEELQACMDEEITSLDEVGFMDNQLILDLFFDAKRGVFTLLKEQTEFDQGSDRALMTKLNKELQDNDRYTPQKAEDEFAIHHYAGPITYRSTGMIAKNKDPLPAEMLPVMRASSNSLVELLFQDDIALAVQVAAELERHQSPDDGMPTRGPSVTARSVRKSIHRQKSRMSRKLSRKTSSNGHTPANLAALRKHKGKAGQPSTVSEHFSLSLVELMDKMGACAPHFVRCIKPNPAQAASQYVDKMVLQQLQYTGMLETIRIRREGFAVRMSFVDVLEAYSGVVFDFHNKLHPTRANAQRFMEAVEVKQRTLCEQKNLTTSSALLSGWKVAKTKVFMKYWHPDILDAMMLQYQRSAVVIQAYYRGHRARKHYHGVLQRYRDELATAATFIGDIARGGVHIYNALDSLREEEQRKGPEALGVVAKLPPKEERKVIRRHRTEKSKKLNSRKFEKHLSRKAKGVLQWWHRYEMRRKEHLDPDTGEVYPWFHGMQSRSEAENLLYDAEDGEYLLRVSSNANTYALSLRLGDRYRHYRLVHSPRGGYQVKGSQEDFPSLADLVAHFHVHPLSDDGDKLRKALELVHDLNLGFGDQNGTANGKEYSTRESSLFSTDDEDVDGADESWVLRDPDDKPDWLRDLLPRPQAERELEERGMVDGRFLVRLKKRQPEMVTYAVSYTAEEEYKHHLLSKRRGAMHWMLNKRIELRVEFLEDCIAKFQDRCFPGFACRLESSPGSRRHKSKRRSRS
eukprot:TRINITY_DN6949_c0_g1_i1.p1 TRINITY_DN6949_c0_g1~~TRINITY_DN6949_c0_g1_i1.p1  ORF type:complete len:1011 (+),score=340.43 TRINITY_DN6949_c0_g1_i1:324-3035(+)